jgi:hypothetical protein
MQDLIQTPNLGPVSFSKHVISYFMNELAFGDIASATNQVIGILQSQEIERLVTPITLSGLEFWVHKPSSLVFTAQPKDDFILVSLVLKRDMSDFIFDNG